MTQQEVNNWMPFVHVCGQPAIQGASTVACLAQWGALVYSCCSQEQPVEVKLTAAKVLVSCTGGVLCSPHLPLGEFSSLKTDETL